MPLPIFLIVLAGLALGAYGMYLDHRKKTGGTIDPKALEEAMGDLAAALADAEAERERLTERVRNLEAIVATETYDLLRADLRDDAPDRAAARLDAALLDDPAAPPASEAEGTRPEDAARAEELARLARRLRGR